MPATELRGWLDAWFVAEAAEARDERVARRDPRRVAGALASTLGVAVRVFADRETIHEQNLVLCMRTVRAYYTWIAAAACGGGGGGAVVPSAASWNAFFNGAPRNVACMYVSGEGAELSGLWSNEGGTMTGCIVRVGTEHTFAFIGDVNDMRRPLPPFKYATA